MTRPIDTAPAGDGWILAFDPNWTGTRVLGWAIVTRTDEGWADEDGYVVEPTMWAPLPDPQPNGSG